MGDLVVRIVHWRVWYGGDLSRHHYLATYGLDVRCSDFTIWDLDHGQHLGVSAAGLAAPTCTGQGGRTQRVVPSC